MIKDAARSGPPLLHSSRTTSLWMDTAAVRKGQQLTEDTDADVCIVGAGIAGLTTAYLLAREGRSVVVLSSSPIAAGETERTTAHLSNALDDRYTELERLHGKDGARLAAESHTAGINMIEDIASVEKIDCGFERLDGFLFARAGESPGLLERELEAAHRAGLGAVEMVERAPIADFDTGPALRFPRQGQVHALKYMDGLARAVEARGGRIYTGARVEKVSGGRLTTLRTSHGPVVTAGASVVATNSPISDHLAIHTKQAPYRTYAIAARIPAGALPSVLLWDTEDPYHYVRLQRNVAGATGETHDMLIVGGEDHKTGQANDASARHARLEAWTRQRFPMVEDVVYKWSGQVMEPVDGLAFIGRDPAGHENVYIATGDSGHGMTHGAIAGMLLADLIGGRENHWAGIYNPSRKNAGSIGAFLRENLNVAGRYADWARMGQVRSPDQIPRGEGAIIRRGVKPMAVHRDENGKLCERSAVCTHLGCIVSWNSLEKSWDCPCHGSRFNTQGQVVSGPAHHDLATPDGASKDQPDSAPAAMKGAPAPVAEVPHDSPD